VTLGGGTYPSAEGRGGFGVAIPLSHKFLGFSKKIENFIFKNSIITDKASYITILTDS
jgi:hypothetical protein